MTLAEYNRLLDLAARAPAPPPAAPVAAVVARAPISRSPSIATSPAASSRSPARCCSSGVSRVPLLIAARRSSTPPPADGRFRSSPTARRSTALDSPDPGPFALTLEWGGPLAFRPGRALVRAAGAAGRIGAGARSISPGEQADVRLSAGLITRRTVANGRTARRGDARSGRRRPKCGGRCATARTQAAAAKDVRALAEIMTLITLDDADVRMVALIDVTVDARRAPHADRAAAEGLRAACRSPAATLEESTPLGDEVILTDRQSRPRAATSSS